MENSNMAIVDEVSQTLTGLRALFDMMTAVDARSRSFRFSYCIFLTI
jgi:hypothetical protein